MKKNIIKYTLLITGIITSIILYLSTVGLETERFNKQIEDRIVQSNNKLDIELKKIINYISYMFNVLFLLFRKSQVLDNHLLVMRLGPLPIAESLLVYFCRPRFVIKTLGSGNISWNSGLKILDILHLKLYKFLSNKCLVIDTVTELSKTDIIKSLEIKDDFIPSCPIAIPSLTAIVENSLGVAPPSVTPFLASKANCGR